MNLTAYEWGLKSPADHFAPESRVKIQRRDATRFKKGPSQAERDRRQRISLVVRQGFPTTEAMGRAVGTAGGNVSKWLTGKRPVPDKYMPALEQYAGGEA